MDRLRQLDRFRRSLEGASDRRIILISATAGMGKSWLLNQFAYEARQHNAPVALIDFSDSQAYDVLALVRRFRDSLGAEHFNRLTAEINDATAPRIVFNDSGPAGGGVAVGDNVQAGDIRIGDVAGRNIIKDNLFIVQSDNPLLIQALEDRITQVFFQCLQDLVVQQRALFLFDTYESNSQSSESWVASKADRWIMRELLSRIRDGQLPNTVVVLAGRRLPEFGVEWGKVIGRLELELFTIEDVGQYLRENRGLANLSDQDVQTLYNAVQGNPQLLGIIGDNLEQTNRATDEDDW
ncbi:MAG: hypothetical protein HC822_21190 [Oscillochloris sp.]|nr:hypothetical protein [Oscillochloris sp.]